MEVDYRVEDVNSVCNSGMRRICGIDECGVRRGGEGGYSPNAAVRQSYGQSSSRRPVQAANCAWRLKRLPNWTARLSRCPLVVRLVDPCE